MCTFRDLLKAHAVAVEHFESSPDQVYSEESLSCDEDFRRILRDFCHHYDINGEQALEGNRLSLELSPAAKIGYKNFQNRWCQNQQINEA